MANTSGKAEDGLYLQTLELAQVQEEEYFGYVISEDLNWILCDIRKTHRVDRTTINQSSVAVETQAQLQEILPFEGSAEEKKQGFSSLIWGLITTPLLRNSLWLLLRF